MSGARSFNEFRRAERCRIERWRKKLLGSIRSEHDASDYDRKSRVQERNPVYEKNCRWE